MKKSKKYQTSDENKPGSEQSFHRDFDGSSFKTAETGVTAF